MRRWAAVGQGNPCIRISGIRISLGLRVSDFGLRCSSSISVLLVVALTAGAAIPAPEQILPDDTLVLLTAPDYGKLHADLATVAQEPVLERPRDEATARQVPRPLAGGGGQAASSRTWV